VGLFKSGWSVQTVCGVCNSCVQAWSIFLVRLHCGNNDDFKRTFPYVFDNIAYCGYCIFRYISFDCSSSVSVKTVHPPFMEAATLLRGTPWENGAVCWWLVQAPAPEEEPAAEVVPPPKPTSPQRCSQKSPRPKRRRSGSRPKKTKQSRSVVVDYTADNAAIRESTRQFLAGLGPRMPQPALGQLDSGANRGAVSTSPVVSVPQAQPASERAQQIMGVVKEIPSMVLPHPENRGVSVQGTHDKMADVCATYVSKSIHKNMLLPNLFSTVFEILATFREGKMPNGVVANTLLLWARFLYWRRYQIHNAAKYNDQRTLDSGFGYLDMFSIMANQNIMAPEIPIVAKLLRHNMQDEKQIFRVFPLDQEVGGKSLRDDKLKNCILECNGRNEFGSMEDICGKMANYAALNDLVSVGPCIAAIFKHTRVYSMDDLARILKMRKYPRTMMRLEGIKHLSGANKMTTIQFSSSSQQGLHGALAFVLYILKEMDAKYWEHSLANTYGISSGEDLWAILPHEFLLAARLHFITNIAQTSPRVPKRSYDNLFMEATVCNMHAIVLLGTTTIMTADFYERPALTHDMAVFIRGCLSELMESSPSWINLKEIFGGDYSLERILSDMTSLALYWDRPVEWEDMVTFVHAFEILAIVHWGYNSVNLSDELQRPKSARKRSPLHPVIDIRDVEYLQAFGEVLSDYDECVDPGIYRCGQIILTGVAELRNGKEKHPSMTTCLEYIFNLLLDPNTCENIFIEDDKIRTGVPLCKCFRVLMNKISLVGYGARCPSKRNMQEPKSWASGPKPIGKWGSTDLGSKDTFQSELGYRKYPQMTHMIAHRLSRFGQILDGLNATKMGTRVDTEWDVFRFLRKAAFHDACDLVVLKGQSVGTDRDLIFSNVVPAICCNDPIRSDDPGRYARWARLVSGRSTPNEQCVLDELLIAVASGALEPTSAELDPTAVSMMRDLDRRTHDTRWFDAMPKVVAMLQKQAEPPSSRAGIATLKKHVPLPVSRKRSFTDLMKELAVGKENTHVNPPKRTLSWNRPMPIMEDVLEHDSNMNGLGIGSRLSEMIIERKRQRTK